MGRRETAGDSGGPDPRRRVPRTDAVLADPRLVVAADSVGSTAVLSAVRLAQQRARDGEIAPEEVADAAVAAVARRLVGLRPVVNATGVLLHTNLGRAPLSAAAREAARFAAPLRQRDPAVVGRLERGRLLLDMRSVPPELDDALCAAVAAVATGRG
jgi:L-seryl-tRNA(Ser) seleniumtransferase